jgi:phage terminase large subunit-like protein
LDRKQLEEAARAADEIYRRNENLKIAKYLPCCTVHQGRRPDEWPLDQAWFPVKCPVLPCPDSKHTRFHMSRARNRVVFGGNRSSKTFSCGKEFIFRMAFKKHPFTKEVFRKGDRHGRVLAQDYSLHEKKHIPDMYEWLPTQLLAYGTREATKRMAWDRSYDSRNHLLHLTNDSWIDFQTYEQDSSKGESVDLDIWWADEEIPEDWYQACNSRIITRGGAGIMGVTPLYRLTWAMRFAREIVPNTEVFKWGIRDNVHNSEKAIREFLEGVNPMERESRENGDFIEFKGIRYQELDAAVHLLNESVQPHPHYPVVMAMDPHQRKGTAITWAFVDPYDRITFFDEMEIKGTAAEVVKAIRERERSHKARTLLRLIDPAANKQVSGFGSQRTTLTEFDEAGMGFTLADNNEVGYDIVSEYLRWDKTKPVSSLNCPSAYFTRACQKTWYGMSNLRWDEYKFNQDRDPKERIKDKDKDFPDCVRYTLAVKPTFSARHYEPQDFQMEGYEI